VDALDRLEERGNVLSGGGGVSTGDKEEVGGDVLHLGVGRFVEGREKGRKERGKEGRSARRDEGEMKAVFAERHPGELLHATQPSSALPL
jgi:hypothetical protein